MLLSLFSKVAGLQACIFVKKRLQDRCFPLNIAKFLGTSILTMVSAGNKAKRLSSVNHTTKTIHHSSSSQSRTSANDCFCISEIQTANNVIYMLAENVIFNLRIYKIFYYLLSFANFTKFLFAFAIFLHIISNISSNISNVSFSSSLNRLNVFIHYQKFVLENLSSGFFQQSCVVETNTAFPRLKVGVYLMLEVHNTLFTDPT